MSTAAKFSLDNPYYSWPNNSETDVQILISKLNDLRAKVSSELLRCKIILEPNSILRQLENKKLSIVFVCSNDLKYPVHVAHLPFLCRLKRTKLVVLKAGSSVELQSYFLRNNLFMFAMEKYSEIDGFVSQFPEIDELDESILPQMLVKK